MDFKAGICNFCGTGCGHLLNVKDNTVTGVFASRNHPVSQGRLCVRGWHMHELLRTADRITAPAIRKNGKLEEVTMDEAIAFVVEGVKKHVTNPEKELAFLGSPRASNEDNYLFMKMARSVFKSNNISVDSESGHRSSMNVLQKGTGMPGMLGSFEEIRDTDFILVVGTDITRSNPIVGSEIHMASQNGARIVTISSKEYQIAKLSDSHLQILPGAKKVALAAIARHLLEENLYDAEFVKQNTEGLDGFANALGALKDNEIEELTGLSLEEFHRVAQQLAASEKAMVFYSTGISGLDEDTISYIYNLFLLAGKIGKEGCGVNPITGICNLQGSYDMGLAPDLLTGYQSLEDASVVKKFADVWKTEPTAVPGKSVYDMLKENDSLKALFVTDHDERIIRFSKEMKDLDLVVYFGAFENGFTDYADVVIPTAAYIEYDGTYTNTERRIQLSRKKTEPLNNAQPAWKIYTAIAEKAGAKWSYESSASVMQEVAKLTDSYSSVEYDRFSGLAGFKWPCNSSSPDGTARYEIGKNGSKANFVSVSGDYGKKDTDAKYPFLLMMGQSQHFWHQNNLMKRTFIPKREYNATLLQYPKGYVEISPEDAKKIQVRDKWPVTVTSPYGSMQITVKVISEIKPGTAAVPYFIQDMISEFLLEHKELIDQGENAIIKVNIEKV